MSSISQGNPLNCNGKMLDLSIPVVMGIINLTPDSFYGESRFLNESSFLKRMEQQIADGAEIIDIGAVSSRPGSIPVSLKEELKRLIPLLKIARKEFPDILISIDTFRKDVAEAALDYNVNIINDISGFEESNALIEFLSNKNIPYILMHKKGSTLDMQNKPSYTNVTLEILNYLKSKITILKAAGITDIIVDPGFGFGKSLEDNYEILKKLSVFKILDCPLLIGLSRKSMIYKALDTTSEEALNGTTALHMLALNNNASILRAHDVKEAFECIQLFQQYDKV